jgi:hypothetical protein
MELLLSSAIHTAASSASTTVLVLSQIALTIVRCLWQAFPFSLMFVSKAMSLF